MENEKMTNKQALPVIGKRYRRKYNNVKYQIIEIRGKQENDIYANNSKGFTEFFTAKEFSEEFEELPDQEPTKDEQVSDEVFNGIQKASEQWSRDQEPTKEGDTYDRCSYQCAYATVRSEDYIRKCYRCGKSEPTTEESSTAESFIGADGKTHYRTLHVNCKCLLPDHIPDVGKNLI